jgi:hypothetical protein
LFYLLLTIITYKNNKYQEIPTFWTVLTLKAARLKEFFATWTITMGFEKNYKTVKLNVKNDMTESEMNMSRFLELLAKSPLKNSTEVDEIRNYYNLLENEILYAKWNDYCCVIKAFLEKKINFKQFSERFYGLYDEDQATLKRLRNNPSELQSFNYTGEVEKIHRNHPDMDDTDLTYLMESLESGIDLLTDYEPDLTDEEKLNLFRKGLLSIYKAAVKLYGEC